MQLSKRASWWVETAVLFIVFTGGYGAIWRLLTEPNETWPESLLRGAVFAVVMLVMLGVAVRRRHRRNRRG